MNTIYLTNDDVVKKMDIKYTQLSVIFSIHWWNVTEYILTYNPECFQLKTHIQSAPSRAGWVVTMGSDGLCSWQLTKKKKKDTSQSR